jgi:hypothetical protein
MKAQIVARILAHTDQYTAAQLHSMSDSVLKSVYEVVFSYWLSEAYFE